MYRAVAWLALEKGLDAEDEVSVAVLAEEASIAPLGHGEGGVVVGGVAVGPELREARVDRTVSLVARVPRVRTAMVKLQREIALEGRIVVVGRDIGTVVLPKADLKLYLEASSEERARRRHAELLLSDPEATYGRVLRELEERDELDTKRPHSPLKPAPDALLLRTGGLTVDGVVGKVLQIIGEG